MNHVAVFAVGKASDVPNTCANRCKFFRCHHFFDAIFDRVVGAIHDGKLGEQARGIHTVRIALHESHVAWAAFEGPVR